MIVTINGNDLKVEGLGADDAPVLIAHHGGGGIGSLAEPKATSGPRVEFRHEALAEHRPLFKRTSQ